MRNEELRVFGSFMIFVLLGNFIAEGLKTAGSNKLDCSFFSQKLRYEFEIKKG